MSLAALRREFPALRRRPGEPSVHYLDSACMSLVPRAVLAAMDAYYREYPGCGGRSLHRFATEVSRRYEASREALARFLGVREPSACVLLRNATEAINVVGQGIDWHRGDRVLVSDQEHNSNLVVWQRLAAERGIRLEALPLPEEGGFDLDALEERLAKGVRLVSLFQTSNLDGRSLPIREIVARAHARGAEVLVDGCQAAPHETVSVTALDVDYYALSLHKMLGPTGTGLLTGRPEALERLRPLIVGGETVEWTTLEAHALRGLPHRLEAGLQNYAGVLGAHAAVRFLEGIDREEARARERTLNERVTRALSDEPRVRVLGPPKAADRPSIFAFALRGVDAHDAALFLDEGYRVLVRSGRHCVHSWYERRGLEGNLRASFYLYNDRADADALLAGVRELLERVPDAAPGAGSSSGTSAAT